MSIRFAPHRFDCQCGRCTRPPVDRMPEEQTSFRLSLPADVHRSIDRGDTRGRIDLERPRWRPDHSITVSSEVNPDKPSDGEAPTRLDVVGVLEVEVCKLTGDHARAVGLRLASEVQRLALGVSPDLPAAFVHAKASGNRTPVWLTSWAVSIADEIRLLPGGGGGGRDDYVSSRAAAMEAVQRGPGGFTGRRWRPEDSGEAVDAASQEEMSRAADAAIRAAQARVLAGHVKRRLVAKAKGQTAHRESTRRRRIEVARTAGSVVAEPDELTILRLKAAELEAYPLRFVCGPDPHDEAA